MSRRKSHGIELVMSDMEWVLASLPDPLQVIDRCVETVVAHWTDLDVRERRQMLALAHDQFVKALEADQGRPLVAA